MKYTAGFLTVMFASMVMLMQSSDARPALKRAAVGASCRPKELTALARSELGESLKQFDEANGKHLGTWSPGFPELQVHHESPINGSKVQCSLHFMAQGLKKILEDQRDNLNPDDVALQEKLHDTISRVHMLAVCVKTTLGGDCTPRPPPPSMPEQAFERKQWSHTLLKTARLYLDWLERHVGVTALKVKGKNMTTKQKLVGVEHLM